MCFSSPKMESPEVETPKVEPAAPIADQTPRVVDGTEQAQAKRANKRRADGLSLFQIQLLPGAATTTAEEPGAAGQAGA